MIPAPPLGPDHRIGDIWPNGERVVHVEYTEATDGSALEEIWTNTGFTRINHPAPGGPAEISAFLRRRLKAAMVNNLTFLLDAQSESAAIEDMYAQVVALTRQMDALIRLELGIFEDSAGT